MLHGSNISGADFRSAENLTPAIILSGVWDPARPPIVDQQFEVVWRLIRKKRIEFGLRGAELQSPDPVGVMGPVRKGDRVVSWRPAQPPHLGMTRFLRLLRERRYARMRVLH